MAKIDLSNIGTVVVDQEAIANRVAELASEISRDYQRKQQLMLVTILKGGFVFLSDLLRKLDIPAEIDFISISSYGSSTKSSGVVKILKDLDEDIANRHILIVEDIIDTGLTLNYLIKNLRSRSPKSVEVCALLDRPYRRIVDIPLKYRGFEIPDAFVVGYGLDYMGNFRQLPYIAKYEPKPSEKLR